MDAKECGGDVVVEEGNNNKREELCADFEMRLHVVMALVG